MVLEMSVRHGVGLCVLECCVLCVGWWKPLLSGLALSGPFIDFASP